MGTPIFVKRVFRQLPYHLADGPTENDILYFESKNALRYSYDVKGGYAMADVANPIFNKKAADKLSSPDDLDHYIRVTNPSLFAVLGACVALLIGLAAWGIFGTVTTGVHTVGAVIDGHAFCYLNKEDAQRVAVGNYAEFDGRDMKVSDVTEEPLSRGELHDMLGNDYLASALVPSDWNYIVSLEGDVSGIKEYTPQETNITTERVAPVKLMARNKE